MEKEETKNHPQLTVTKRFNVPAENVFDAWLDPEIISQWMFGPELRDEEIIKLETDPREGGPFSFVVRRGDDVLNHLGKYLEIDRPHRLVFTWGVESESAEESEVTIDIESTETSCQLTLVHELDPKWEEYACRTKEGWSTMLEKLKEIV
ncbi:SRPBCC family protein [Fodinibius halophilus]|uniref:SRPBCC domain-containing protein n=1 Tax=Fodinibius halophilus TaxID=1736908 RepID=A0A6M1T567_9BACT|nr:SRPBCC domain-containing protein [Fodinibius halophilus]NGP87091.1 SRPBCC domain-containing protein [Fodinibius halophilus]